MLCLGCNSTVADSDCVQLDAGRFCSDCVVVCDTCGEAYLPDDGHYHKHNNYCPDCFAEHFAICDSCDKVVELDDAMSDDGGTIYCHDCYCERYFSCEHCGSETDWDYGRSAENGDGCFCQSCYDELYACCARCGNECGAEEMRHDLCPDCQCSHDGSEWEYRDGWKNTRGIEEMGTVRAFGVELETSFCDGHGELSDGVFGCKEDGSISGMEFVSPPLSGDGGLFEVREFCKSARELGFEVDGRCGFHLHVDLAGETADGLRAVCQAYLASENIWRAFVSEGRKAKSFAKPIQWNRRELTGFDTLSGYREFCRNQARYTWANVCSYYRHSTIEIRLWAGTLSAETVCNWAKAHCRFVDWAHDKTAREIDRAFAGTLQNQFDALCEILGDTELAEWLCNQANKHGAQLRVPCYA